jgi:hypothetical protein
MNLLFMHGPPASGKYTIGRELAARTGYAFFHDHLVVDEVLQQHIFGTPGFVAARDGRWREYFTRAVQEQPPGVIFTFNPENTVPQAFIDWLFHDLPAAGARLLSIELQASEAAIEARLASSQRQGFSKLTDVGLYRRLRDTGTFTTPLIPRVDFRVDTERAAPPEAAREIARHFGLVGV